MKNNISMEMGGTLIIVIFVALCLTIFATMSFTTAYSDFKLISKTQEITYDYYAIEAGAEKRLSEVYDMMAAASHDDSDIYYDKLYDLLSHTKDITVLNNDKNDFKIYYEVLGNKNQKICVTLKILNNEAIGPKYEILAWNLANIELPVYEEENIDLWEGID